MVWFAVFAAVCPAAERLDVRRMVGQSHLVVTGRLTALAEPAQPAAARSAGRSAPLQFIRGELTVEQVLKGPKELTAVQLQWLAPPPAGPASTEAGPRLWHRGRVPAAGFRLGDRGLWFLRRAASRPPTYTCPADDCVRVDDPQRYRSVLTAAGLALAVGTHPRAPISEGLQLTVETTKGSYGCNGPVRVVVSLTNVGRLDGDGGPDPAAKRRVPKLDTHLLSHDSTAEVRVRGTKPLPVPAWAPSGREAKELVALPVGGRESGLFDISGWLPASAGLYRFRLISQPPGLPRLESNWVWICRGIKPTGGLALCVEVYRPRQTAARVPVLKASVVNVTDRAIGVPKPDHRLFTEWCKGGLVDERGRNVPWRPRFAEPPVRVDDRLRLAAGAMRTVTAPIDRLVEFERPGRYTLQLICRLPGVGLLISNPVEFEVLPKPRPRRKAR
jgi:hypothetical protein